MRRGIYTVVNDRFSEWLLALFGSLAALNPDVPVRVIPFGGPDERIRRICAAFGHVVWEPAELLRTCELIASAVCRGPGVPGHGRGMFRRFAAFGGPFDEFLYLDADTLVIEPLAPLFDVCAGSGSQLVFTDRAGNFAYSPGPRREELRATGAPEWNAGIFYARAGAITLGALLAACRGGLAADRALIRPDAADQSFLNWFIATRGLRSAQLASIGRYGRCWAFVPRRVELAGHLFEHHREHPYTRPVPVLHWAGLVDPGPRMPHWPIWQAYRAAAGVICATRDARAAQPLP